MIIENLVKNSLLISINTKTKIYTILRYLFTLAKIIYK